MSQNKPKYVGYKKYGEHKIIVYLDDKDYAKLKALCEKEGYTIYQKVKYCVYKELNKWSGNNVKQ